MKLETRMRRLELLQSRMWSLWNEREAAEVAGDGELVAKLWEEYRKAETTETRWRRQIDDELFPGVWRRIDKIMAMRRIDSPRRKAS